MRIRCKRVYEPADPGDGLRVLVDRLWPRGLARERAQVDLWTKDLAPSEELRRWFDHRQERYAEFRRRYLAELAHRRAELASLLPDTDDDEVTLLFAARDESRNNAVVLAEALRSLADERKSGTDSQRR
jgi:uncharacterized protein YeaO (DUF488 family)